MRAAAGLQVDALDLQHANAAESARGLHAHAAHQLRVGIELGLADPAVAHRVRPGHQTRDAGAQRLLVQRLCHVEIQPRVAGGDRAAVHRVGNERAQQVCGGVKAHVGAAALGVDARRQPRARRKGRQVRARSRHVGDVARPLLVLARVGDDQHRAVGRRQRAGIARLAAAQRVEHGAVEDDAVLVCGQHGGLALQQRSVFAEQFFGHQAASVLRIAVFALGRPGGLTRSPA